VNTDNGKLSSIVSTSYSHVRSIKIQGSFGSSFSLQGRIAVESIKETKLVQEKSFKFSKFKILELHFSNILTWVPFLESAFSLIKGLS
jgi:hypothetical protein